MPLQRRSPKWGFKNFTKVEYLPVNVDSLEKFFGKGEEVSVESLKAKGLIKSARGKVKVLGRGKLSVALNLKVHAVSESARKAVEAAKGTIQIIKSKQAD